MTTRPHDALFKAAFEAPARAAGLLRCRLPAALDQALDWSTLVHEPGSYVNPELADSHSDLLFSVEIGHGSRAGERLAVYLLCEHQSSEVRHLLVRTLGYQVRIWERFLRDRPAGRIPAIISLVVCHTPDGWSEPRRFHDLVSPAPSAYPGLAELVPQFSVLIEDLADLSDDELYAMSLDAFAHVTLWFLRDGRNPTRLLSSMSRWIPVLASVLRAEDGMRAFLQLVRYASLVLSDEDFGTFHGTLRTRLPEVDKEMASHYETTLQRGRAEGRADLVRRLLGLKFREIDPRYQAQLAAATSEQLDRYAERILTATTIAEVFEA